MLNAVFGDGGEEMKAVKFLQALVGMAVVEGRGR